MGLTVVPGNRAIRQVEALSRLEGKPSEESAKDTWLTWLAQKKNEMPETWERALRDALEPALAANRAYVNIEVGERTVPISNDWFLHEIINSKNHRPYHFDAEELLETDVAAELRDGMFGAGFLSEKLTVLTEVLLNCLGDCADHPNIFHSLQEKIASNRDLYAEMVAGSRFKKGVQQAFSQAAKRGDLRVIQKCMDLQWVDMKQIDLALHLAAKKGQVAAVQCLSQHPSIDLDVGSERIKSVLTAAINAGQVEVVKCLLNIDGGERLPRTAAGAGVGAGAGAHMQRYAQVQNIGRVGATSRKLQRLMVLMASGRSGTNHLAAAPLRRSDSTRLFTSASPGRSGIGAIASNLVACVAQRVASALANKCRSDVAIQLKGLLGGGYGAQGVAVAKTIVESLPAVAPPSISLNDLVGGLKVDFDYQALSEQVSVMKGEAEADFAAVFDEVLAAVAAKKQSLDETNNENDKLSVEQAVSEALSTLVP